MRVFHKFLVILPADFSRSAKINYFKSRRIRQYKSGVQENLSMRICLLKCLPESNFWSIFLGCLRENRSILNFGGPAGGSALERASPDEKGDTWLVQTDKEYFIRVALGQIVANHDREAFGKNVV